MGSCLAVGDLGGGVGGREPARGGARQREGGVWPRGSERRMGAVGWQSRPVGALAAPQPAQAEACPPGLLLVTSELEPCGPTEIACWMCVLAVLGPSVYVSPHVQVGLELGWGAGCWRSLVVARLRLLRGLLRWSRRRRRRRIRISRAMVVLWSRDGPIEAGRQARKRVCLARSLPSCCPQHKHDTATKCPSFVLKCVLCCRIPFGLGGINLKSRVKWVQRWPHRPLLVLLGGVAGALLGVLLLLVHQAVLALRVQPRLPGNVSQRVGMVAIEGDLLGECEGLLLGTWGPRSQFIYRPRS